MGRLDERGIFSCLDLRDFDQQLHRSIFGTGGKGIPVTVASSALPLSFSMKRNDMNHRDEIAPRTAILLTDLILISTL